MPLGSYFNEVGTPPLIAFLDYARTSGGSVMSRVRRTWTSRDFAGAMAP
ncbi:MAG: hypothetical protein ACXV5H_04650 [Halobacteriota archaeon]